MSSLSSLPRRVAWPLALLIVVAVSAGSATAARKITGGDVANSTLTGSDVRNSSLSGADIQNRSLTPRDFRESIRGPIGPQGPAGRDALQVSTFAVSDPVVLVSGEFGEAVAVCPRGSFAVSGGHAIFPVPGAANPQPTAVAAVVPVSISLFNQQLGQDTWVIQAGNLDGFSAQLQAIANCVATQAPASTARRKRSARLARRLGSTAGGLLEGRGALDRLLSSQRR